ncbi:MAG: hypothetical protein ABIQ86_16045 [Steroidobacteraceae bacterium]
MRQVALFALAAIMSAPAFAVGRLAQVSVIDRDTGQTLTTHLYRGEYWVAGRPGAHYAIQIHSRDGQRLLAVTSIDGVNVVTGETAAVDQGGYLFEPGSSYDIAGWRKSNSEIAAFIFTSIPKSYASRTGRPENVGVIGVALFRERAIVRREGEIKLDMPIPQTERDGASMARERAESKAANQAADAGGAARAQAPSLGTGHGRRETSVISLGVFERESPRPNEIIRIRYDSRENLVAMGVIPQTPPRPRQVDPFPNSPRMGYVPDP